MYSNALQLSEDEAKTASGNALGLLLDGRRSQLEAARSDLAFFSNFSSQLKADQL